MAALASRPFFRSVRAQELQADIVASTVSKVPVDPEDRAWNQATPATISLSPQNLVLPRINEAGAKEIRVRALYDQDRIGFLLKWLDAHRDVDLGTVLQYRDAAAIQFPEEPGDTPPAFTMGQKGKGVIIYHWKSDWEFGRLVDVEEAHPNMYGDLYLYSGVEAGQMPEATDYLTAGRKEYLTAAAVGNTLADPLAQERIGPVQKMRAEGFGTIEPHPTQDAQGKALYKDDSWRIVISVPRRQGRFTFVEAKPMPLAFAIWDGSRNERNGQKAYSIWNSIALAPAPSPLPGPEPVPTPGEPSGGFRGWLAPALGGFGGAVAAVLLAVLGLRIRRMRQEGRG